jgi:F-type H+-transporting ATPase subunit delta
MTDLKEAARPATVLDDGARQVARVYAAALLTVADEKGNADAIRDELDALVGTVYRDHPQLEEFLSSMAVGRVRKEKAIQSAFEGRADAEVVKFLQVLNKRDRLGLVPAAAAAFRELLEARRNRVAVLVRSAVPLSEPEMQRLRETLRAVADRSGVEPVLETRIDPDLLGGLVVQVGDFLYDSSVRTRLEQIKNQILEKSSHEIQSGRDRFSSV